MSLNMNSARSVAQEAVSWYLNFYNEFDPHAANIERCFRGPVTAITIRMLKNSNNHTSNQNGNNSGTVSGQNNWREFLNLGENASLQEVFSGQADADELSRRAKARLDAFLEGVKLAVVSEIEPPETRKRSNSTHSSDSLSLVEGLVGFKAIQSDNVMATIQTTHRHVPKAPQMGESELTTRLELYLRSLNRVKVHDCVIAQEPVRALKARAHFCVTAFVNTVGTVQHASPILTKLLVHMTKELMAVDVLSPELLHGVIQSIVSRYVQTTSFASLAFLSSPETSAEKQLSPAILKYLGYLQKNWEALERQCEQERMLNITLDGQLRRTFQHCEFRSIGHLLEVCSGFRDELQNIELPCNKDCDNEFMIDQAVKDMQREVIAVNGSVLPRVADRTELIQLLASALNRPNVFEAKPRRRKKKKKRSKKIVSDEESDGLLSSSGNEADNSESSVDSSTIASDHVNSTSESTTTTHRSRKRGTFKIETVDMLTKRILLAASRTGTAGDAYFIVRDLFGGDGVEVVSSLPQPVSNRPATIDLWVKLASVTIHSNASFDVYPKSMVGNCEPLIQIHTTTTETIALQEVRAEKQDGDFVLQERPSDAPSKRILSIRPALYEKVSVWQAPS